MKKVVVFGGSGFLGSHVADALTEKGFDVVVFDRVSSPYLSKNQRMVVGDILDSELVANVIVGSEYVYHFAGIADIQEAEDYPVETVKSNILSTVNILEACRKNNVKRFVYASTVYIYSDKGSFYRSSKQSCEMFVENYQTVYNLDYTILRYGSLYGKRANKFNFINNIINQAFIEKKIVRHGDGNEIRDYINVVDAARASVEILSDTYKNAYIMITGTQTLKVKDLLSMISEMLNNEIEIVYLNDKIANHYEITPYSFRPRVAKKYVLPYYFDLGQGVLDCLYDVYKQLSIKEGQFFIDLPKSIGDD